LQQDAALDQLLSRLKQRQTELAASHGRYVPMFLKIAPDLDADQIQSIAAAIHRHGIDGVVATNTTLNRDAVAKHAKAQEAGGLSGAPLLEKSNSVIRQLRNALGPAVPIIGVGGVMSGSDAQSKLNAGADLVQVYTGLIYRGPALVEEAVLATGSA
jgi:dihydroorotate dehydrogenase